MRVLAGWLLLLPFLVGWGVSLSIVAACIERGGVARIAGVLVLGLVGGGSLFVGYVIGPVVGWVVMGGGMFVMVFGLWKTLTVTPSQMRSHAHDTEVNRLLFNRGALSKTDQDKLDSLLAQTKDDARRMLRSEGPWDLHRLYALADVISFLTRFWDDEESCVLRRELERFERELIVQEASGMLERGKLERFTKQEEELVDWLSYRLGWRRSFDTEAADLKSALNEMRRRK